MRPRTGHSLLELAVVLVLAAATLAAAVPGMQRTRHELAVAAARRELAAALTAARATAVLAGGARLVLDLPSATVWTESVGGAVPGSVLDVGARHGVALESARGPRVELRFDALGVGRMANATITIRRGAARTQLVVSAYGRVRP